MVSNTRSNTRTTGCSQLERERAVTFRLANNCLSREAPQLNKIFVANDVGEDDNKRDLLSHATSLFGCLIHGFHDVGKIGVRPIPVSLCVPWNYMIIKQ
jgi:hypothetical protein